MPRHCASNCAHRVNLVYESLLSFHVLSTLSASPPCSAGWILFDHIRLDVHRQGELPDIELWRDEMGNYCSYSQHPLSHHHLNFPALPPFWVSLSLLKVWPIVNRSENSNLVFIASFLVDTSKLHALFLHMFFFCFTIRWRAFLQKNFIYVLAVLGLLLAVLRLSLGLMRQEYSCCSARILSTA